MMDAHGETAEHGMPSLNGHARDRSGPRLLGVGGGMRAGSLCTTALQTALDIAAAAGATTVMADVRELDLPIFNDAWEVADYPPSLAWLLYQVRTADAFIICSPTYHGTVSGAVKNVLDALNYLRDDRPRYLRGKPVGLMALGGLGAVNTLTALGHVARALNGIVTPTNVVLPESAFDANHVLHDKDVRMRLSLMIEEVLDLADRLSTKAVSPARHG